MTNEELYITWHLGNKTQKDRAFAKILKKNQGLINKVIADIYAKNPKIKYLIVQNFDDFQQIASMKVINALETYDMKTGYRFSTWLAYRLLAAKDSFHQKQLHLVHQKATNVSSLNFQIEGKHHTFEPIDQLEAPSKPLKCNSDEKYTDYLKAILSPKEKEILSEYYSDLKPSLEDMGESRGVSRERVRQIKRDAIAKMKRMFKQQMNYNNPICKEIEEVYTINNK